MSSCHSGGCSCGSHQEENIDEALARMSREETLRRIRHTIVVLSGKGGVGKSTVAVNLAMALAMSGRQVGLLDVDLHGPSVPTMLGLAGTKLDIEDGKLVPADYDLLKVISIGFLLERADDAVIWRGPAKAGVIKQLVEEVVWGDLDYLIVDCPPGTGDEPLSVVQTLGAIDGAVIVTTPQDVALADVRKSISFCHTMQVPVLGVVENMSGLICPHCSQQIDLFKTGGGEAMAGTMAVPFLGRIPLEVLVVTTGDAGVPMVYRHADTPAGASLTAIAEQLRTQCEAQDISHDKELPMMRFAIPMAEGQLCMHFGHCEQFALVDVDATSKQITGTQYLTPPPHEPGVIPRWLHEQGATTIIAGGMGMRAQQIFAENGITVVTGAPVDSPEALVTAYLQESLVTGTNTCDH